jgi:hypothetical protein
MITNLVGKSDWLFPSAEGNSLALLGVEVKFIFNA